MSRLVLAISSYLGANVCYCKYFKNVFIPRNTAEMMMPKLKQAEPIQPIKATKMTHMAYRLVPVTEPGHIKSDSAIH